MGDKVTQKKPGFFKKLFSSKTHDSENNEQKEKTHKSEPPSQSDGGVVRAQEGRGKEKSGAERRDERGGRGGGGGGGHGNKKSSVPLFKVDPPPEEQRSPTKKSPSVSGPSTKPKKPAEPKIQRPSGTRAQKRLSRKKQKRAAKGDITPADPNQRLEFPTTPEMILAIHKRKPFLDKNEEWLIVELNEYECLVENLDIIKMIANHSKFFEVEPDELWEEFFEYVEDMPSYDEIITYDVWQEFRDEKYSC